MTRVEFAYSTTEDDEHEIQVYANLLRNEIRYEVDGNIRVQGLPYGTYLVVETTVPHDLFQAEPFIVTVDPEQDNNPWGAMATPKDSVMTGSDSYQKFTVLDEEIEVYLRITKIDEETGKPVLLPDTAFQIYWLDEQGHYRYDSNGNPKLVTMTDTVNGHLTKDVNTFHTNGEGILTLPEKLPLGKYRIVEVTGPNGFYNEWLDSAGYENGVLADDADGSYYVDFEITTDRIYAATGDKNENGMDTLVIGENYSNHETLGKLTIRKTGEVLAGWKTEVGALDPWMTGEAEDGNFVYETRPLAGAEYTITAAEDIYTQDRQTDNYGNRTLWYAKGDVVAVVTTGDGSADIAAFAPARTKATYDFLSVIHDGTIGEVSVTLPLGSYHIEETKPPYGYIGTPESYDVTFAWDNERNDVVMATSIAKVDGAASSQSFEVVRSKDANADFTEQQTLKFYNDREKAKVGVYKVDRETGKYLAGAVFNLYAADDIYSVDGKLLFAAGELVATSPETGADGYTYFDCDIPIRGEYYGSSIRKDATTNSGNYIVKELRAPLGYYANEEPMEVTFTYDGQAIMVLDNTCANKFAEMTSRDEMFLPRMGLEQRALFIVLPDNDTTFNFIATMLYTQLFDQLFRLADSTPEYNGALPVHVRLMMDEFANVALPKNFKNILAVCRSRNISCDIILQNIAQLKSLFKDDWEGIIGNCDTLLYLGGNEYGTYEYLSKILGKETERTKSQSIGKGSRGSSSDSLQTAGRELCMPDEIRRMRDDECLLLMRSEDPVIDRKYNLLKHPNVKYTPDAGGEPYVIPPDYMGDAVTITMDAVAAATAPEITEEMYEQLDYLEKHPEENYYENEENFSQYDQGD